MTAPVWTEEQLASWLDHQGEDDLGWLTGARELTERWLQRGDGVAVFENHDLGHRDLGQGRLCSYGSAQAQLEPYCARCREPLERVDVHGLLEFVHQGAEPDDGHAPVYPPTRLPDFPGEINWRYVLIATCGRAPAVQFDVDPTPAAPGPDWEWPDGDLPLVLSRGVPARQHRDRQNPRLVQEPAEGLGRPGHDRGVLRLQPPDGRPHG